MQLHGILANSVRVLDLINYLINFHTELVLALFSSIERYLMCNDKQDVAAQEGKGGGGKATKHNQTNKNNNNSCL